MIRSHLRLLETLGDDADLISRVVPLVEKLPLGLKGETLFWGFPPALIPLWCDPDVFSYIGLWRHWFCERRVTIVEFGPSHVEEVARTVRQLVVWLLFRGMESTGRVSAAAIELATLSGVDLDMLGPLRRKVRGDEMGLMTLPYFAQDPPLGLVGNTNKYRGDFPHEANLESLAKRREVAGLEIPQTMKVPMKVRRALPWLYSTRRPELFRELLAEDDMLGAWMTLNGSGWKSQDAGQALSALGARARDLEFTSLVKAWRKANGTRTLGY